MSTQTNTINGRGRKIFITGATGYIGRTIAELAIANGYQVRGLSRSEEGNARLKALGATPVNGTLETLDVLSKESAAADIVFHLAYIHDPALMANYDRVLAIDAAAVDALAEPLRGTDKSLVISSGTALVEPDPNGNETTEDSPVMKNTPLARIRSEQHALGWATKGVKVSAIRLAPYVYGRGGHGFLFMQMQQAAKAGEAIYVSEANVQTSVVHVEDAARLYLLAADHAKAGEAYNCTSTTSITTRDFAEAIGALLKVPVRSISLDEKIERWGPFLGRFTNFQNRASSRKAREQLAWEPVGIDLPTDVKIGSYVPVGEKLLKEGSNKVMWSSIRGMDNVV